MSPTSEPSMPRLIPCPACHSHVLVDEHTCPHCSASLRTAAPKLPVVLMGLALAGCPAVGEPDYGVPDTGLEETTTSTDTDTDTDTGMTSDTDSGTDSVGEPEYGVPDTSP
ncbi:hypothetical protein [Enhygromyxa salina]|uniref:hypothetical protein n=1 Tax=Enhygromyxa salina TaxID=215803 RepID=UPI0006980122|nr:hypothetical protein [Enhygromyxa salina]